MTRTDWLLVTIAASILAHAALPRYEWRAALGESSTAYIRIDRWTGRANMGHFIHVEDEQIGTWLSQDDIWRAQNAGLEVRPATETLREQATENARRKKDFYDKGGLDGLLRSLEKEVRDNRQ
jgi:hypothetical protein